MTYSEDEKKAINYFLVKLMKVDGHTEFAEITALYRINQALNISVNQADASLHLAESVAKEEIRKMEVNKRIEILSYLKQMAQVDGHFDKDERDVILDVFQ